MQPRDELDQHIRRLQAERARPERREPTVEELLQRLIATLHAAYTTPPDGADLTTKAGRLAEFERLRGRRYSVASAAWQVGVSYETGRRYEAELRKARDDPPGAA